MLNHEIPGVTVVRTKVFPDAVGQFRLALAGHYFETVRVLFGLYPTLRSQFEEILLAEDLEIKKGEKTEKGIALDSQLQRLRDLWVAQTARGGFNNNNRWKRP